MITAYVGLPGAGKTLSMVNDLEAPLKNGYKVYTNTPFFFEDVELTHASWKCKGSKYWSDLGKWGCRPIYLPFKDFSMALRNELNAIFALDEASILFSNYFWQSIDLGLIQRLAQSRKDGIHIFYTSQRLKHTMSRMRDLTNVVVECEKHNILGLNYFVNVQYDSDFYNHTITKGSERERGFILGRKFISAQRAKYIYKSYDTSYKVGGSIINIDKNRKSVDAEI